MSIRRVRATLTGLALAAAAALAACTTPAPPPPPPPPPPAPAIPPGVALSTAIVQDAAVYSRYMARASTIDANFHDGADVAQALVRGETISPGQLLRGEIAYGAIVALQDPNYVANVRAFAGDPESRQRLAAQLIADPDYAVAFTGSDTAAGLVEAALLAEGRKLFADGTEVRQAAYSVQSQAWSKGPVEDRPGRLANAKSAGLANAVASMDEIASLRAAVVGQSPLPVRAPAARPPYPPVVVRSLAVAAMAALGEAGDDNLAAMAPMFEDAPTATCLHTARLNLYQCLAVARPHYEDIFCLGQHVMMDGAQCLMIAAGAPAPVYVPPPEPKVVKAATPPRRAHPVRRRHKG